MTSDLQTISGAPQGQPHAAMPKSPKSRTQAPTAGGLQPAATAGMAEDAEDAAAPATAKRRRKLKKRANRANVHEKQLSGLLSKARQKAPARREGTPELAKGARRGRRGATLSLYESGTVTKAIAEPEPPKFQWQARLLAKRFPKCTPEQIAEALDCFDGDTDKAGIICERQSRNAALGGPALGAKDEPLSMEELEVLGSKQLAQLAKKLRFNVSGNANELRHRLAALVGLTPDVMVRLEWILDAALAAELPSIDRQGAAIIRSHIAEGRFTAVHYIQMFTERLRITDDDDVDDAAVDSDEEDAGEAGAGQDGEGGSRQGTPDQPFTVEEGALRRDVYKRLRKARCGKHLRMRARLCHADKLRSAGTLASTLGGADFALGFDEDGNEVALGSTWKRASQLLELEIGSDDGSGSSDEEEEKEANRTDDLAARRRREWQKSERDVDGWHTAPTGSWVDVAALAQNPGGKRQGGGSAGLAALVVPRGRSPPVSPPGDLPSSPSLRKKCVVQEREERFANLSLEASKGFGGGRTDPDLEAWRADLQRRREDAGRVGWQLTRRLPDLDLKPVWLEGVEGGYLAMYERLAAAEALRVRSPHAPMRLLEL